MARRYSLAAGPSWSAGLIDAVCTVLALEFGGHPAHYQTVAMFECYGDPLARNPLGAELIFQLVIGPNPWANGYKVRQADGSYRHSDTPAVGVGQSRAERWLPPDRHAMVDQGYQVDLWLEYFRRVVGRLPGDRVTSVEDVAAVVFFPNFASTPMPARLSLSLPEWAKIGNPGIDKFGDYVRMVYDSAAVNYDAMVARYGDEGDSIPSLLSAEYFPSNTPNV